MRLIILEDNADRQRAMQSAVEDRMPQYVIEFFEAVAPMIECLEATGLYDVALVSLDHDLEIIEGPNGNRIEPGTGVDAASWFAKQPAVTSVIVHTTNSLGGDRMMDLLLQSGWNCDRVVPYGGEDWINELWFPMVRKLVVAHSPNISMAACGIQILKNHWRMGYYVNQIISECIRAARCLLAGSVASGTISIQLFYLNSLDQFTPLVPEDGVLAHLESKFGCGALIEEFEGAIEAGPKAVRDLQVSSQFRDELEAVEVREVQVDVIRVPVSEPMQALMVSASLSDSTSLESHRAQAILAELRSLIELSLAPEVRTPLEKPGLTLRKMKQ